MSQHVPDRSRQSYRHEAYLWSEPADFTEAMASFVEEGVAAQEPVMVALTREHTGWLRDSLSRPVAGEVRFVDMVSLGGNPARIIPAWQEFVGAHGDATQPVRGIGEPIWPGRHAEELLECQLHEALLNVAIEPDTPLWLICPYDTVQLTPAVVEEAHRSHPVIVEAGAHRGSARYAGREHVDSLFAAELADPLGLARRAGFAESTLHRLTSYVALELYIAGLPVYRAERVAEAVQRLAGASLQRGAPEGSVRIWSDADAVICEVSDTVPVTDALYGRRVPTDEHEALWQANQLCDLVQLRSTSLGTTVRVFAWKH